VEEGGGEGEAAGCARSGSRASSPSPPAAVDEGRQRTVEGGGGGAVPLFSPRTPLPNPLSARTSPNPLVWNATLARAAALDTAPWTVRGIDCLASL